MVTEILAALSPAPGDSVVDCTLGHGGHALELLARIQPGGTLLGLDADPLELPKTEKRLREAGYGPDRFTAHLGNFAGLASRLSAAPLGAGAPGGPAPGVDCILADLGVSSMQLDDPARGFSVKISGPLDMRMNPNRGISAAGLIAKSTAAALEKIFTDHSDEPHARTLALALSGGDFPTTKSLGVAIRGALPRLGPEEIDLTLRRVFQALRIAVNDEFSALEMLLRLLPSCLKPGGRVAILSFHSGEDRRVKKSFEAGLRSGIYGEISTEVIRSGPEERRENPRSTSAKLRWARKR
jgi:16S rRNA (cytosine1402-N4)-methyltransferase